MTATARKLLPFLSLLLVSPVALLSGCASTMDGTVYTDLAPRFDVAEFFDGEVKAWGIVQGRNGKLSQRFTVEISGHRAEGKLILDEIFDYSLGEGPATRRWELIDNGDGSWVATANDVENPGTGRSYGNAFNLNYTMGVPVAGRIVNVNLDDWMWAMDERTIVNRSYVRKFGLTFAEVTLFMQKQ